MNDQTLKLDDIERIVRLLDQTLNPNDSATIPERRRKLMRGLCELVAADVWMWSNTVANPERPGDLATTCFLDEGWSSDEERVGVYELLAEPDFGARYFRSIAEFMAGDRGVIVHGRDVVPADLYDAFLAEWSVSGLEHCLFCVYPLGNGRSSNAGLHRRRGKPPFTERERMIVQTVYTQIDSLHRYGDNEAAHQTTIRLSMRERMTLVFVLAGYPHKTIADRLGISPHTVNDYVKSLHRTYDVSSRAELQAKFFLGGGGDAQLPAETE